MLQRPLTIPEEAEQIDVRMSTLYELIALCDGSTVDRDANRGERLLAADVDVDRERRELRPQLLVRALVDCQGSQS
jgi:hypothetical protein